MSTISSVTYCPNVALVTLRNVPSEIGIIGGILTTIAENDINVDMISQTAPLGKNIAVAFSISMDDMGPLMPIVNGMKQSYPDLNMELSVGMTKLSFFDTGMVNTPGVAAKVFTMLAEGNITVNMITTSTVDISILIPDHDVDAALNLCTAAYGAEPEEVPFS